MKNSIPMEEGFIEADNARLYYRSFGKGEPLVILHGGPGFDHHHMLPFQELGDKYRVIFYDQRGSGDSIAAVDSSSITVDNFVGDLEALRKGLKLEEMTLIGHSWGGNLALFYALKHPERVKSLVLIAPTGADMSLFPQFRQNLEERTSAADAERMGEIMESEGFKKGEAEAFREFFRVSTRPFFHDESKSELLNWEFGRYTIENQMTINNLLFRNLGNFDIKEQIASLNIPTLLIHGEFDPLPLEGSYKIHQLLPDSRLVIIEDAGHFLFVETPEPMFEIVRRFLENPDSVEDVIPAEIAARLEKK